MGELKAPSPSIEALPDFGLIGTFQLAGDECRLKPSSGAIPPWRAVYAFVQAGEVRYVGAAENVQSRMRFYLRSQRADRSGRPVHGLLRQALNTGEIGIFARKFDQGGKIDGLPVDLVLGVEAGLITRLNPAWNRRGRRITVEVPTSSTLEASVETEL